jgi:cyclopropane-fatty-acyl-phospholipid synthase
MLVKDIGGVFGTLGREASKALVMQVASAVRDGRLDVQLPDGTRRTFGGERPGPTASMRVNDDAFFTRLVRSGELGLGESYMDGLWDVDDLTQFLVLGIENRRYAPSVSKLVNDVTRLPNRRLHLRRRNSKGGSRENVHAHYDLSNDLFALFLDPTMTYSSAVFTNEEQSLEEAQRN